jgi:hypothetical protein
MPPNREPHTDDLSTDPRLSAEDLAFHAACLAFVASRLPELEADAATPGAGARS